VTYCDSDVANLNSGSRLPGDANVSLRLRLRARAGHGRLGTNLAT
jgi:hypothetical protein